MVRVGDKVSRRICTFTDGDKEQGKDQKRTGTVIYIHPRGRFYTVEFQIDDDPKRTIRQSYRMDE